MTGGDHTVSVRVVAAISLGVYWIAQEDTRHGTWRELVGGSGVQVGVALASEHA
jgi:hypothetical protein